MTTMSFTKASRSFPPDAVNKCKTEVPLIFGKAHHLVYSLRPTYQIVRLSGGEDDHGPALFEGVKERG